MTIKRILSYIFMNLTTNFANIKNANYFRSNSTRNIINEMKFRRINNICTQHWYFKCSRYLFVYNLIILK